MNMKSMNLSTTRTTTTLDPQPLGPSRSFDNKPLFNSKVPTKPTTTLSTRSTRDPLSNITNAKKSETYTKKQETCHSSSILLAGKSQSTLNSQNYPPVAVGNGMAAKRPSNSWEEEGKGKSEAMKNKKRKSDPMIIDEEVDLVANGNRGMVTLPLENIDQYDYGDPQAVVEYVNDIYQYLMVKEKDRVDSRYMSNQVDINEKMRAILVDWLVEVHRMFKLLPETLYLSVAIIDRFLSMKQISRDILQLVGITSMLIASKYEEIYAPECNDFVYISDGAYTKLQIISMEQTILNTLNFNITHPTALHFLRRYSKAAGSDYTLHTICKYLIELVLVDVKFLKYVPSLLAAASVYLGRAMTFKMPLWTPTVEYYTTYSESVVRECALEMNELLKKSQNSSLKAIKKKYSLPKFGQVAELPLVDL